MIHKNCSWPILDTNDNNILCQQYLNLVYHKMRGHSVNNSSKKNISETYGEILYASVDALFSEIILSEQDIFIDLGSGLGKVVLQVFLKSTVRESCGIEIVPELHRQALIAAQKVQNDLPGFYTGDRKITFLLGNFLEITLSKATIVLAGSPCFSPKMLHKLGKIIDNSPSIHSVFSLRPIYTLKRLPFKKAVRIECSWDTALCYIYSN